ncbi:Pentatricopeptide repeat [Macleaya cordata]|uniref:Pentatricopeptide repeat n=1 Tax=Macleaya cordata TaxID=56857 RepID=A0A200QK42_MACCD|nr:Pentatricopeptide repeat [Macleaya cordata]
MKLRKPISRLFSSSSSSSAILRTPQQFSDKNPIAMESVRELHASLIRNGLHTNPFPISDVLRSYALNPLNLNKALLVFNQIRQPTTFIYNWMIRAFSLSDQPSEAIVYYNRMRRLGLTMHKLTFIFVFKACARVPDITSGKKIHVHCLKLGFESYLFVCNALILMYSSCGELGLARKLFDGMPNRDLVSWNSLICGYSQNNRFRDVLILFKAMQANKVKADAVTMVKVVLACSHLDDQEFSDSMVKYIEENNVHIDVYLGNTLIDLYGRRGSPESAQKVFHQMKERNIVSWNTMIKGYAKARDLVAARKLFDDMPVRDVISWTSIVAGYSQSNRHSDAIMLFREMMKAKVKPDEVTVASVLSACAHLGSLDVGEAVHEYILAHNIKADIYVGNALIDMYCKCGCFEKAMKVFTEMTEKDEVSWTSVITGLAVNGYANEALECFSQMLKEGVQPRDVTFIGVLLACTHAGLVDKGLQYFESMKKVHLLEPKMKHYGCIVDLLSRSGNVEGAYEFIKKMPVTPDAIVWRILLSACKLYGNVVLAEIATNKLLELDTTNSGNYVLLSNTYASADRWDDAENIRNLMIESDVHKAPGCSSIEVSSSRPESVDKEELSPLSSNQALMR